MPMDSYSAPAVTLRRRPRVRFLRTMAFGPYDDVPAALRAPGFAALAPDETAMVVFDGCTTLALNLVAAFVWDLLDGTRSLAAAVDAVVAAFGVGQRTAWEDVSRLSDGFLHAGLVEAVYAVERGHVPESSTLARL